MIQEKTVGGIILFVWLILWIIYFMYFIFYFLLKTLDYVWTYAQSCEHFIISKSMDILRDIQFRV